MTSDPSFADLAECLRSHLADVEDRYLVDQLAREHAELQRRLAIAEAKLKVLALLEDRPTLEVVA